MKEGWLKGWFSRKRGGEVGEGGGAVEAGKGDEAGTVEDCEKKESQRNRKGNEKDRVVNQSISKGVEMISKRQ